MSVTQHEKPEGWKRPDVLLASLAINITTLALPIVILQVYDRILPNKAIDTFTLLISGLLVAAVLEAFLRIARSSILTWKGAQFEYKESLRILDQVLHADLMKFEAKTVGGYLDKIDALKQVREFYSGQTILMLVDLPFVFVFLMLIWIFAQEMVFIPMAIMALFAVVSYLTGKQLKDALRARSSNEEHKQNFLIETLQGIHVVKSMALEAPMMRRFERLQGRSAESIYDVSRINSVIQSLGATFSQVVMMAFVGIGSIYVVRGELTVGALAAGTMLSGRVLQPALKAMGLWTQIQAVRIAGDKLDELLELPPESQGDCTKDVRLQGGIELQNVSFKHEGTEEELLTDISLKIEPGEAIAITGPNGSGKSTLVELLMGFMAPTSGKILLDDRDITTLQPPLMRAQIGFLPQHGVIFEGTILDNLTLFREGAAVDRALELSDRLGLTDAIMRLPQGLDTQVGGSNLGSLPAGVRQQMIIVRSLVGCMIYGEPSIILFDDADASLDVKNDELLVKMLEEFKGKRTMVIVTHRGRLLRMCDRRFTLHKGQLQALQHIPKGMDLNRLRQQNTALSA